MFQKYDATEGILASQRKMLEVMLRSWMRKTLEFEPEQWSRGYGQSDLEPADYVPVPWGGTGAWHEDPGAYADNFYRIVEAGNVMGIAPSLLDSLDTWGAEMWPLADWEAVKNARVNPRIRRVRPLRTPAERMRRRARNQQ